MITTPEGEDSVSFISFHVVSSEDRVEYFLRCGPAPTAYDSCLSPSPTHTGTRT